MNPWPLARVALTRRWRSAALMAMLVALATAAGIGISAFERASRRAAAHAADAFDLVVGAPGGPAQLVLAAVYLQPESVPLMDAAVARRALEEPEAVWASPIGFGDSWRGHPVVGVAPAFVTRAGMGGVSEGRLFEEEGEAVEGSAVELPVGAAFSPLHGLIETPEARVHADMTYRIVGRLPPTGTPWDGAVLVPIESVWALHGLGTGHPPGSDQIGPPWQRMSGVPAVVLKPRSVAGAYQLRARYRTASSTAVFPGEVLAGLFRTVGDVRAVLSAMALVTSGLVVIAVFLAFISTVSGRAREHAVLRAIGAPAAFVVGALWLELAVILGSGVAAGLLLGWAAAAAAGSAVGSSLGIAVRVGIGERELWLALAVLLAAAVAAAVPALLGGRESPASMLKR